MRLELTRVGLLAEHANHYTTRGALIYPENVLHVKQLHDHLQYEGKYCYTTKSLVNFLVQKDFSFSMHHSFEPIADCIVVQ